MLLEGDVFEKIKEIESESVQCVVTSPPYFHLRDYGIKEQIGHEPSISDYLNSLQRVMTELRRVLKKDGTIWFNIADMYGGVQGTSNTFVYDDHGKGKIRNKSLGRTQETWLWSKEIIDRNSSKIHVGLY